MIRIKNTMKIDRFDFDIIDGFLIKFKFFLLFDKEFGLLFQTFDFFLIFCNFAK